MQNIKKIQQYQGSFNGKDWMDCHGNKKSTCRINATVRYDVSGSRNLQKQMNENLCDASRWHNATFSGRRSKRNDTKPLAAKVKTSYLNYVILINWCFGLNLLINGILFFQSNTYIFEM